jgi:hypothetical protein
MAEAYGDLTSWFARHLVMLEVSYTVKHRGKAHEQTRSYSTGFLIWEVLSGDEGVTVWVTAGHCMRWIDQELLGKPELYGDVHFRLVDTLHSSLVSDQPIPFDYVAEPIKGWDVHTSEQGVELGLDVGVIFLRPGYSRPLAANKIMPVEERNWQGIPDTFDKYFMLGLPAERVERNEQGDWLATPSMVEITRLPDKPQRFSEQTDPMFYGVASPESEVRNIQGMSGGPIIGLKQGQDGRVRYWVIAIQSGWFSKERIVCASLVSDVRDVVRQVIDALFQ